MKFNNGKLSDFIEFNPREKLSKGSYAKNVPMSSLLPYTKVIPGYDLSVYNGGTKFRNGDTLVARITPCLENGKTAFVDILERDEVGFGSTEYIVLRAIPSKALPDFVFYLAISDWFRSRAIALMNGSSGRQRVQVDKLKETMIEIPDLEIQRKIVRILSTLDEKIELNQSINDSLLKICECIFDDMYQGARIAKLGDLLYGIESGSRPKGGAEVNGIPSIGAEKIERFGYYDFSTEKYINEDYYYKMRRGKIESGDVLLYKDGAYTGKSSLCLNGFPYKRAAINEHVFKLNTKDNYAQFYLYCCINRQEVQKTIHALASSKAAQPGLNQAELRSVDIKLNDMRDIQKFEEIVSPMMYRIANNAIENKYLTEIRDALIPQLISGEINLEKVEI